MQENQVEVTKETLGQAAREMMGAAAPDTPEVRQKFMARQRVLWKNLDIYRRSVTEGRSSPIFDIPFRPGTGWTMRSLQDVATDLEVSLNLQGDQIESFRQTILGLAAERDLDQVFTHGTVLHYGDHPDRLMRFEIQIKLAADPASSELGGVPAMIYTIAVNLAKKPNSEDLYPFICGMDVGRLEWEGMALEAEPTRVDPQKVATAPRPDSIFMPIELAEGRSQETVLVGRKDLRTIAANSAKTAKRAAQLAGEDTFNLFGVNADMLRGVPGREVGAALVAALPLDAKITRLFERGYRMSEDDLRGLEKMKVVVRSQDDIKHFLDELFRHGNLWLYNTLVDALKAQKQGSVSADTLVFRLTVKGNWQEYRGPVNAKIKMRTLFSKTGVELAVVKGELVV